MKVPGEKGELALQLSWADRQIAAFQLIHQPVYADSPAAVGESLQQNEHSKQVQAVGGRYFPGFFHDLAPIFQIGWIATLVRLAARRRESRPKWSDKPMQGLPETSQMQDIRLLIPLSPENCQTLTNLAERICNQSQEVNGERLSGSN
jgi:hypothetical protein